VSLVVAGALLFMLPIICEAIREGFWKGTEWLGALIMIWGIIVFLMGVTIEGRKVE